MIDYDGIDYACNQMHDKYEKMLIQTLLDAMDDGEITRCRIAYEWEICESCRGDGYHSKHLGVISHEQWNEWSDQDQDFYMSGGYDKKCDRCDGSGKIKVLDTESLPEDVQEYIDSYYKDVAEDIAIRRSEMYMGC